MHLFLHDYANYAFTRQLAARLAAELAGRDLNVTYAFNASYDGPNSKSDPVHAPNVHMLPIGTQRHGKPSESFASRLKMELAYSKRLVQQLEAMQIDTIVSANTPSLVQNRLAKLARRKGIPLVSWVQDLYGVAAYKLLKKRLPVIGSWVGRYFVGLDKQSLRLSRQAVLITDDFREFARTAGIAEHRVHVIENWAPVEDIPRLPKDNAWARAQNLDDRFRFVYSGTLAMKHNPELLVRLARRLQQDAHSRGTEPAEVLVVSSSPGARWVAEQAANQGLPNLRRLEFQPAASFPSILGIADVLLAVLENDAAAFSVPSKVLSYLCAGKPILAAIPAANLAARIIRSANAGLVVEPTEPDSFAETGLMMMRSDQQQRAAWGQSARDYAERTFDLQRITSRFVQILSHTLPNLQPNSASAAGAILPTAEELGPSRCTSSRPVANAQTPLASGDGRVN